MKVEIIASTADRLQEALNFRNMKQADLSRITDIDKASISLYLKGKYAPKGDKLYKIALALGVSPQWLSGFNVPMIEPGGGSLRLVSPTVTDDTVDIPVIGEIAAGYNLIANEEWTGETVTVPASYLKGRSATDFFVLVVKGSSMYPHYQDGDRVLILKQDHINDSGDVAAVLYDSECATLKKIEIAKDLVRLVPINPEYEPKEIKGADLEKYHILGVPRLLIREIS